MGSEVKQLEHFQLHCVQLRDIKASNFCKECIVVVLVICHLDSQEDRANDKTVNSERCH